MFVTWLISARQKPGLKRARADNPSTVEIFIRQEFGKIGWWSNLKRPLTPFDHGWLMKAFGWERGSVSRSNARTSTPLRVADSRSITEPLHEPAVPLTPFDH